MLVPYVHESYPDGEELRMVRALVLFAIDEAAHREALHVSFRGFRIQAHRLCILRDGSTCRNVELVIWFNGHIIDRESVTVPFRAEWSKRRYGEMSPEQSPGELQAN